MKRLFWSAVLYTALASLANAADPAALAELREGSMKKLTFHAEPQAVSDETFTDPDGGTHRLSDFAGKHVVLNFWATWCAPCRKEMPGLDALERDYGGEDFAVVTVASGRNTLAGINRFFEEEGIAHLPKYLDPNQALSRDMAVLGLPITVILNPDGQEIARLRGDAEWDSESAKAIVEGLIGADG